MNILKHLRDHFIPHADNNYKPHALAHRTMSLYAGLLISLKLLAIFSLGFLPENQALSSALTTRNILELTNYSRESYNEQPLLENPQLDQAAQAKAQDMLDNQYFAHNSPQGRTPWDFIKASGYNYAVAGENLAINFYSAEGVEQAWMNSPGHKANILNKDFQDIGIGIVQGQYNGVKAVFVVQMFGANVDQPFYGQDQFTTPKANDTQNTPIALPNATNIALTQPIINDPGFVLTNQKDAFISGEADGATSVYILVNHVPKFEFPVEKGIFSGTIQLSEGTNVLNAVAFDEQARASQLSSDVTVKLDSTAPAIIKGEIKPIQDQGNLVYKIDVQAQGDPVKVIADIGGEGVMLQPTSTPNEWVGTLSNLQDMLGKITITAFDLAGNTSVAEAANISHSAPDVFGFLANRSQSVSILGKTVSANMVNDFYIYFVLALLVVMGITIAVHRNVQHVSLIAQGSAMIALALIFWVT